MVARMLLILVVFSGCSAPGRQPTVRVEIATHSVDGEVSTTTRSVIEWR